VPRYDWHAIRSYYDAGHTMRETQARFGFSNGAWARAVERGDIQPRPGRPHGRNGATRERVVELLSAGMTKAQVARELGVTKSSVSRHAARAGLPVDERCRRRYDWVAVQQFYDEGHSIAECVARFGFGRATFNDARRRGDLTTRPRGAPIDEIFVQGVHRNRNHLKQRLDQAGLLSDVCEGCGLSEWRGRPLTLQLHHLNGDAMDHRVENLTLLCPNCHTQTDNWGGRNVRRKAA
jgi:transposase